MLVPLDTALDFTVFYLVSGALSREYLTTATGPATATLTIGSFAPLPGTQGQTGGRSCVLVTDERTGATTPATYSAANGDGSFAWTHALALPQATTEGSYELTFWAEDCASHTRLTLTRAVRYIVDNT